VALQQVTTNMLTATERLAIQHLRRFPHDATACPICGLLEHVQRTAFQEGVASGQRNLPIPRVEGT